MQQFEKEILGKRLEHSLTLDRAVQVDEEARTVELAFASDAPIFHGWGYLILDHSAGSMRPDRLENGAALLWNHSWDDQIGVIDSVSMSDGKSRAVCRFSRSECGEENFQDVLDGIKRNVSVGFMVHSIVPEPGPDGERKEIDGYPVYRSFDWEPYEVSLVAVPADISVGVGRALEQDDEGKRSAGAAADDPAEKVSDDAPETRANSQTEKKQQMKNEHNDPVEVRENPEITRAEDIVKLGDLLGEQELARDFAAGDKSLAEFKAAVADKRSRQAEVPPQALVDMSKQDLERYSIAKAILADADIRDGRNARCLETEVSDEARKNLARNTPGFKDRGGVIVPTNVAMRGVREAFLASALRLGRSFDSLKALIRAGLDTKTDTAGQEAVFTEEGSFIDLLRNRAMVMQLGATVLSGLVGNVAFPKQIGAGTFSWVAENPGADVAESNLTLDQVTLSPKTGQSTTSYSRQLLAQSNVNVDGLVLNDLSLITSLAIDRAAIHGSGASNQPTGIYAASGVNSVAFGGPISLDKAVDMETEIATDNADIGSMAYLTTPGARGKAKKTQEFSSSNGFALWRDGELNGYRAEASNQVSSVMLNSAATGGTSHGIIFGVWSQLLVGEWGAMEIITDPYRLKKQGMIEVTNFVMVDIALRYPEAFCKGTGQTLS